MASILRKAKNYKIVPKTILGDPVHQHDPYTVPPQIYSPPAPRKMKSPDDVTDFPKQQTVPIPEAIPYSEGKYRPPSVPVNNGYYPYNLYLQQGKVYWYCTCGISLNSPWCDFLCNKLVTRNRPIYFNVNESGYYKICACKMSANSPFCNGTHRDVAKFTAKTHMGSLQFAGFAFYWLGVVYILWNFYT